MQSHRLNETFPLLHAQQARAWFHQGQKLSGTGDPGVTQFAREDLVADFRQNHHGMGEFEALACRL